MNNIGRLFKGKIKRKDFLIGYAIFTIISLFYSGLIEPKLYTLFQDLINNRTYIVVLAVIEKIIINGLLYIYLLSLASKRLRDIGISPWWSLIYLSSFVMLFNLHSFLETLIFIILPVFIYLIFTLFLFVKK